MDSKASPQHPYPKRREIINAIHRNRVIITYPSDPTAWKAIEKGARVQTPEYFHPIARMMSPPSIGHVLSAVPLCRSSTCSSPIPERVASGSGAPPPRRELLVLLSCVAHTKVRRGPPAPAKGKVLCSSPAALSESDFPKPPVDCRSHRVCSLHTAPRVSEKSSRDALRPLLVAPASPCLGFPSAGGACG